MIGNSHNRVEILHPCLTAGLHRRNRAVHGDSQASMPTQERMLPFKHHHNNQLQNKHLKQPVPGEIKEIRAQPGAR